jgi:hypothetical protein
MAKQEPIQWINEERAAELLGYKVPVLRIYTYNEKKAKLPIRYAKINRKKIVYSLTDINNYINTKAAY